MRQLQDSDLQLVVSVVSIYEMAVAIAKKRWPEAAPYFPDAAEKLEAAGYAVLPITGRHVEAAANLPRHHNDPWDRLLVATAESESLTLVTPTSPSRPTSSTGSGPDRAPVRQR